MGDLGDRLRKYRKRAGLSIYDVENLTGRHFTTISKYERGVRQPGLDTLRELAKAYEVSPSELIWHAEDFHAGLPEDLSNTLALLEQRPEILEILPSLKEMDEEQIRTLHSFLKSITD